MEVNLRPSIYKKHIIAFCNLIGWEMVSLSMIVATIGDMEAVMICTGLLFIIGVFTMFITSVVGIVLHFTTVKIKDSDFEKSLKNIVIHYMSKTGYLTVNIILIIVLSPILPLIFIGVADISIAYYGVGIMSGFFGIMIYQCITLKDRLFKHFFKFKDTYQYFNMASGENSALLDSLYSESTNIYNADEWNYYMDYVYNLVRREKAIDRECVQCYCVSTKYLKTRNNYNYLCDYLENKGIENIILLPLSQFKLNKKNMSRMEFIKYPFSCCPANYEDVIRESCIYKDSLIPEDYNYSAENIPLDIIEPQQKINSAEKDGDIYICVESAANIEESAVYTNCLLVIRGAKLLNLQRLEDDTRYSEEFLNPYIECDILSIQYSFEEKKLRICYDSYSDGDEELVEGFLDYSFTNIEWYWDECFLQN